MEYGYQNQVTLSPQVCSSPGAHRNRSDKGFEIGIDVLSWLIVAGGLLTIGAAAYIAYVAYGRIPLQDAWSVPDYLATHVLNKRPLTMAQYLSAQHNEHRILIPKLFLLADYQFFRGRDLFAIGSIFAIRLLDLAALLWVFRRFGGLRTARWRTASGIAAACLFAPSQLQNFRSGFQIAFVLPGLFVDLTLIFVLLYTLRLGSSQSRYLAAALVAGTAASYSLAAGILVWPVMLGAAAWMRIRKAILAVIAVVSTVVVVSYLYQYESPPGHASPLAALHHPWALVTYAAEYLGAPWVCGSFSYPVVCGTVGLGLAAVAIGWTIARKQRDPLQVMLTALLLFEAGTALMTSLGRVSFGRAQALSSRYGSFSLVFWLSLSIFFLHSVATRRRIWFAGLQALVLLAMSIAAVSINEPIAMARSSGAGRDLAALAMLTGVFDYSVLRYNASPDPEETWRDGLFLRQHHLSIFSTDLAGRLAEPLRSVYQLRPEDCWGQLLEVRTVGDTPRRGLRLRGWAWDPARRRPVKRVVLASGGNIIGYGQPGFVQGNAVALVASRSALYSGWMGYVKMPPTDATGTIYGVVDFGSSWVCQVRRWPFDSRTQVGEPLQFSIPADSELPLR